MSKYIPGNQKHLSLEDRKYIEQFLNNGSSFKDIARFLCKDPTTISKEVKLHRVSDWYHKGAFSHAHNFCVHTHHCRKTNVCRKIILCNIKCTSCPTCNQTCPDFVKEQCNRLNKAPYVCNECPKAINHCPIAHKYRYDAIFADRKYRERQSSSRTGINMTKHELHQKDMVITPLIYQGQSSYQIITNHPELDMSVRTLCSYLNGGVLTARNVDLKRKVKFKPRKVHKTQISERSYCFSRPHVYRFSKARTRSFCRNGYRPFFVTGIQMRHSHFLFLTREKLFLAFIMNRCTKGAVRLIFDKLEHRTGNL